MDKLTAIRRPVEQELTAYKELFDAALAHEDDFLGQALDYVRRRQGKMMRPLLVVLMAKELGKVSVNSLRSAVTLELLHTASLVHDDVVDESGERRGQRSVNAVYDNKVAVLVGDYLLSTSLLQAAQTSNIHVVEIISRLGVHCLRGRCISWQIFARSTSLRRLISISFIIRRRPSLRLARSWGDLSWRQCGLRGTRQTFW